MAGFDGSQGQTSKERIAKHGMEARDTYQLIRDEVDLDGSARLNLATFVTTWMEPEADQLYAESANKNIVDKDEYPQTAAIEDRCVRILADLWHSPAPDTTLGTSTTGSSEACMLAGLALKRRWQIARRAAGKSSEHPNIVFSSAVQVVWEKFANYFEVEPRFVAVSEDHPTLDGETVVDAVDENTIGVVPILGVTYTGVYEPVAEIAKALDELEATTGLSVPIHVDAASGGFVAPFLQPETKWDFSLSRVVSINTSGHKYGLVYPGLGWVIWREASDLPEELIFRVSYLGGDMPTFGLNFSRPGAQVLLQYYMLLRLGQEGFTQAQGEAQMVAHTFAQEIGQLGMFEIVSDGTDLPVVSFSEAKDWDRKWNLHNLSSRLREMGWQVPVYPLPDNMADQQVMRVVVRYGFRADLAELLLRDFKRAIAELDSLEVAPPVLHKEPFHH